MTLLSTYENDVADILHDPTNANWSIAQLDRYINEARTQLVMDTGCLRTLQTANCTISQETYTFGQVTGGLITAGGSLYTAPTISFAGGGGTGVAATLGVTGGAVTSITFTNFGSGYTSAPTPTISDATGSGAAITIGAINVNTYDILGINLLWGAMRYRMEWRSWSVFSAIVRQWVNQLRQPSIWAVYGHTQYYLGPIPDQTYALELDTIILPTALADYVTNDPIPVMYQGCIKWYAAYLAKNNEQAFGEAEIFKGQYEGKKQHIANAYTARIPNLYQGINSQT